MCTLSLQIRGFGWLLWVHTGKHSEGRMSPTSLSFHYSHIFRCPQRCPGSPPIPPPPITSCHSQQEAQKSSPGIMRKCSLELSVHPNLPTQRPAVPTAENVSSFSNCSPSHFLTNCPLQKLSPSL